MELLKKRHATRAEQKYNLAMRESEELLRHLRNDLRDVAFEVAADILFNRRNVAYMTTIYEAVEEVNSPLQQISRRSA